MVELAAFVGQLHPRPRKKPWPLARKGRVGLKASWCEGVKMDIPDNTVIERGDFGSR